MRVLVDVKTIDQIVARHESKGPRLFNGNLKGLKIDLSASPFELADAFSISFIACYNSPECPLTDNNIDSVPHCLLLVCSKVFDGSSNSILLKALDHTCCL